MSDDPTIPTNRLAGALPQVTVILVSYNTKHLLEPCMAALDTALRAVGGGLVRIVDNASRDGSADFIAERFPHIELIRSSTNQGFGRANNLAVHPINTPFVLLLNTDAFVEPHALVETLAYLRLDAGCGILGVRLEGRDGTLQPSCRYFPSPLNGFIARLGLEKLLPKVRLVDDMSWDHRLIRDCDWVPGCFYLVRKEVIDQVGLFDPRYFLYFEEVDHCRAARNAGWRVVYFPGATVIHWGGESAGADGELTAGGKQLEALQIESSLLYFRKNLGLVAVALHLGLEILAAVLITLRRGLARHGTPSKVPWPRVRTTLALARRTMLGSRPTR